ncbi:cyclic nucleotide-binding domain-containing protein [Sphingomonas sp. AOB5]|uniref:cyclic nucleotide-binding domain-containing protein n=1 Tax=Sphingomonas sp. AOB5 TaxID=3034017 RepID=UPI0023F9EEC6|nr:cyclic nucleotide-binding domain-containing protein [Sphingomonas sp. AOB5]MDF7775778.1 cyclic nucleotide-binding domain-containing protein [Sphingomonas sp. AOB5]
MTRALPVAPAFGHYARVTEWGMFSSGSLVLQLSYALLVLAVVTSRKLPRIFIALSAAVALAHAIWWSGDPAAIGWMALLLGACAVVLGNDFLANRRARFSDEEEAMLAGFLAHVPRHAARHLIDQGIWLFGAEGDMLTREGEPVERLLFIARGEARVFSGTSQVALCGPGELIGEATVLAGDPATATVVLAGPARFWCIAAPALRAYLTANPDLLPALERSFARAVGDKLRASNRTIAAAGGVAA